MKNARRRSSRASGQRRRAERSKAKRASRFDFFVSFTEADRADAIWVRDTLTAAGYKCCFQYTDFHGGQDFLIRMMESANASERTIALFSSAYLASEFGWSETVDTLYQDILGRERKLLWVTFEPDLPVDQIPHVRTKIGLHAYRAPDRKAQKDALLDYVRSAITGQNFGRTLYTHAHLVGEAPPPSDRSSSLWAAWIPTTWNSYGAEPMPMTDLLSFRPDVLWNRDRSPLRAIIADEPGADLVGYLRAGAEKMIGGNEARKWHALTSVFGRDAPYAIRRDVIEALDPAVGRAGQTLGIVATLGVDSDTRCSETAERAVRAFQSLDALLPNDALVLRIEGASPSRVIRIVAAAGRELVAHFGPIDIATRIRSTYRAVAPAGGSVASPITLMANAIRVQMQAEEADSPWLELPHFPPTSIGVDTVAALVQELNTGRLPPDIDESRFLRLIRDSVPTIWLTLLRRHARERAVDGWYAGLEVASAWSGDFGHWLTSAAEDRFGLLYRPESSLGRIQTSTVDTLVLAALEYPQVVRAWSTYASADVREFVSGTTRQLPRRVSPDTARRVRPYLPPGLCDDPRSPLFWLQLASDPAFDATRARRLEPSLDGIVSSRSPLPEDPALVQYLGYHRSLIRPYGSTA